MFRHKGTINNSAVKNVRSTLPDISQPFIQSQKHGCRLKSTRETLTVYRGCFYLQTSTTTSYTKAEVNVEVGRQSSSYNSVSLSQLHRARFDR